MGSVYVSISPNTVSASSTITFLVSLTNFLTTGDIITFNVPYPGSFTASTSLSLCTTQASSTVTVNTCTITAQTVTMKLSVSNAITKNLILYVGNFKNPFSTTSVVGITATLTSSTGTTKESFSNAVLDNIVPDTMTTASLTPQNTQVGASSTTVTVSMTIKNQLKSDGKIIIEFPYWNPSSSSKQHMISSSGLTCTGTNPLKTSISCSYNTDSQKLTLSSILTSDQAGGTTLTFTVNNIKNPYSTAPKTGFTIQSTDSVGGAIDSFTGMTLTVSDWAALSEYDIYRADTIDTVGEQSQIITFFKVPLPVDSGCRVRIDFPSDMPVTTALSSIQGFGLFSSVTTLQTTDVANNYIEVNGCSSYQESGSAAYLYLSKAVNIGYVKTTGTFKYSLYDMVGTDYFKIAQFTTGITFQNTEFSTGEITGITVTAVDSTVVQSTTKYKVTFTPSHSIQTNSKLVITFPTGIVLTDQSACTLVTVTGSISTSPTSCKVASNIITIINPFGTGSFTAGGGAQSLVFSVGGTNPSTVTDAGTFQIQTYATISGTDYAIDSSSQANIFSPTPSILTASIASVSSYKTSDLPTTYTLSVTPNKIIPQNGVLDIIFPTDITLAGSALTSCSITKNGVTTTLSGCTMSSSSPITLKITDAFAAAAYSTTGTPFTIQLAGLKNPRTIATTGSFSISTAGSSGGAIEAVTTGVTTIMQTVSSMSSFTVTPVSSVNGVVTDYKVTVMMNSVMQSSDVIKFTFPPEITLGSSVTCSTGTKVSAVSCSLSGSSSVSATLTFSGSPIASGTSFDFLVQSITNPSNTKPTSTFTGITAQDSSGNQLASYTGTVTTGTTTPATVTTMSLAQDSQLNGADTTYTIQYSTKNQMTSGSAFIVNYPSSIAVSSSTSTCQVKYNSISYPMTCVVNTSTRTVQVSSGLTTAIPAGSTVQLFIGPVTNPTSSSSTASLSMTSYTDSTYAYSIDNIPSGLVPGVQCTDPCKTCLSTSKTTCTSCDTTSIYKYLSSSKCLTSCPTGTYPNSNLECVSCLSSCLTCSQASTCDSCNTGGSFPYMYNNLCVSTCPDGTFQSSGKCLSCNSNCKTCSGTSTTCLTCTTSGNYPYLSNNQCVSSCSAGYVSVNYQCVSCTSPCSTCIVDQTTCSTCSTGYLYGTKCLATCPTGTVQSGSKCIGCDPNCAQCSSSDTAKCITCASSYLLYENTCYKSCPAGYRSDKTNTTCEIIPIVITPNITETNTNTSLSDDKVYLYFPVLTIQLILTGVAVGSYFKDKSSLVISSMIGLWGPLEFIAYCAQAYLAYDYEIADHTVYLDTNSTNSTSTGRLLQVAATTTQNTNNDIWPLVFYGTCFALAILIITNLIWCVLLFALIHRDEGFKEYRKQYCATPWCLGIFGSLISYKLGRFLYCRFFGLDKFYVPFTYPQKIHYAFNFLTIFNIVLTLMPIIFVDIYGIIKHPWGSQFYIIIIETLLLTLAILIISIWEFKHSKLRPASQYGPKQYANIQDMSSMVDDDLMRKIEEQIKSKLGGHNLESFIERLKRDRVNLDEERGAHVAVEDVPHNRLTNKQLKGQIQDQDQRGSNIRRCNSMIHLGDREKEQDDRVFHTDPIDPKSKASYENRHNPFDIDGRKYCNEEDHEHPNNCIAEAYKGPKKNVDKSRLCVKVIQTGDKVMTGEDYDKDYEKKLRDADKEQLLAAEERKDQRTYDKIIKDESEDERQAIAQRKKNRDQKMRGRKDKYYEQVDDEDQSFAEDTERGLLNDHSSRKSSERLGKIDEESVHSGDEADKRTLLTETYRQNNEDDVTGYNKDNTNMIDSERQGLTQMDGIDTAREDIDTDRQYDKQHSIKDRLKLEEQILGEQDNNNNDIKNNQNNQQEDDQELFEAVEAVGEGSAFQSNDPQSLLNQTYNKSKSIKQNDIDQQQKLNNKDKNLEENDEDDDLNERMDDIVGHDGMNGFEDGEEGSSRKNLQTNKDKLSKDGQSKNHGLDGKKFEDQFGNTLEEDIFKQQQLQQEQLQKLQEQQNQLGIDGKIAGFNSTVDIEKDIENSFIKNNDQNSDDKSDISPLMNKLRSQSFDSNGEEKGEPDSDDDDDQRIRNMTDPNKRRFNVNDILGEFDRDEKGNIIILQNSKGELVDKKGDRVNEKGYLIDAKTGDVVEKENKKKVFDKEDIDERGEIPPPFNLERFNFNPHDVRGYFDRDAEGNEILGTRKNDKGQLVDKLGRLVNQKGFLVDQKGNLVDKRGRIRLHHKFMKQNKGDLPQLFNYKGKKYDIKDVIGDFDKDRSGNIIIRRDKDNNMVDKKGRRVNNRGYLVDQDGNVINKEGKIVFEHFTLSKDNEIPKLFPFLKFNLDDILGEFEMDPLGNPMLSKNDKGQLIDNKGRRVNEKGYLLDNDGNIINKRGYKQFCKLLLEKDGDIPKVFRTGLFRKDTVDSFNQLMNEIEDLEKLQEMEESNTHPANKKSQKGRKTGKKQSNQVSEQERIAKRIDQIIEEDGDDDDLLMKELEELAQDGDECAPSEGGNTSVDSMMEDTPSNYNIPNQRFMDEEQMRERARQARNGGQIMEDLDMESEYNDLPGRKLRKKKKKKRKVREPTINEQDLLMAKAYGGMGQGQLDKLLKERRRKEQALQASQLTSKPPLLRNAANSRAVSGISKRGEVRGKGDVSSRLRLEESKHEQWDAIEGEGEQFLPPNMRKQGKQTNATQSIPTSTRSGGAPPSKYGSSQRVYEQNNGGLKPKKNNLMGLTGTSFNQDRPNSQYSFQNTPISQALADRKEDRERRLSHIANSVTGFYREPSVSDHSKMRSTHESNFAQNVGPNRGGNGQGKKRSPRKPSNFDPELERIYGTARGLADVTMLSDWEKDSQQTSRSGISQLTGLNTARVKGLESIYLQRLEPASKGRRTQMRKGKGQKDDGKAKFRIMHHRLHDEPEWHLDNNRDDLDSIISGNYKEMEQMYKQEFITDSARKRSAYIDDANRPNIFHGNFYQYKEKMKQQQLKSVVDLGS